MESKLKYDMTVDKEQKKVYITREFDADLDLVWDAFTKAELLDQWTAPKPFVAKTKVMDFKVGGKRFWAMVTPDGQSRWVLQKYTSITPKTNFKLFNTFSDENENADPVGSDWDYSFSEKNGITTANIVIYNESLERMMKMIEMGFKEGYNASLINLDELFKNLTKK